MAEESDGIEEALEGQLRMLVSAAVQVGERLAREREEALRRAGARSGQEPGELRSRYGYGVEADNAGAAREAGSLGARLMQDRARYEYADAGAEGVRSAWDRAEAQRLLAQADREDQRAGETAVAAEHEPDPGERARAVAEAEQREVAADRAREDGRTLYDSAERRASTARDLEARGIDREVVATRMRADVSQARPATEAVRARTSRRVPRARGARVGQRRVPQHGPSR
ncbi:hypothetical protein D5R93_07680 [Actinomyces lilanjuaniae]|uniref:Colicin import membrane protein n=1 Tax=Actinomyces lilanjuaniae TaxID=2321394 RepID=A0ABM6Z3R2_9ACTO|nr:hypothetical protein [Actinomyces lilanjuaniae]AYD89936.1 hypothetical protein D5R93_07680 [Actinomyces lilanjuaniae]